MNNKYLTQRLQALSITEEDNTCQGFSTFSAHPYYIVKDEYYNLTNKELERFRPSPFDNILFSYSTIWGKRIFYRTKTSKWQKTVERIRYNEKNRYEFWDRDTNKIKRLHKYHTQKGGKAFAFFNGLYAYYIKPLQAQGYAETQIIEQLRPTFRRIIITEGEFKAFAG